MLLSEHMTKTLNGGGGTFEFFAHPIADDLAWCCPIFASQLSDKTTKRQSAAPPPQLSLTNTVFNFDIEQPASPKPKAKVETDAKKRDAARYSPNDKKFKKVTSTADTSSGSGFGNGVGGGRVKEEGSTNNSKKK